MNNIPTRTVGKKMNNIPTGVNAVWYRGGIYSRRRFYRWISIYATIFSKKILEYKFVVRNFRIKFQKQNRRLFPWKYLNELGKFEIKKKYEFSRFI